MGRKKWAADENILLQAATVGGGGGLGESTREKDDVEFFFATEAQIKN